MKQLNLRPAIKDTDEVIYSIAFSNDAQMLASGSGDGSINLYNAASGRRLFRLVSTAPRPSPVTSCQFRPKVNANEPQVLISVQSSGTVSYFNAFRGQLISSFQITGFNKKEEKITNQEIYCMKLNSDGSNFACAGKDGAVRIYDVQTQKLMMEMSEGNGATTAGHSNRVFSLVYHDKDPNVIFTGGWDQTTQIWDMRVGHSVNSLHQTKVYGDSLDVRDETLLVGNFDVENQLVLYDLRNPIQPEMVKQISFFEKSSKQKVVQDFDPQYMAKIQEANEQLISTVEMPDDDNAPEPRAPAQDAFPDAEPVQQAILEPADEPTMVYDCKFGKTKETFFAAGSGGKEVRMYKNDVLEGMWKSPAAVYCACVSGDGRYGAVGGNGFGVQAFALE